MYKSFAKFKTFAFNVVIRFKEIITSFSFDLLKVEYESLKKKLKDLKGTNWDLAQYHFLVGNFNALNCYE